MPIVEGTVAASRARCAEKLSCQTVCTSATGCRLNLCLIRALKARWAVNARARASRGVSTIRTRCDHTHRAARNTGWASVTRRRLGHVIIGAGRALLWG